MSNMEIANTILNQMGGTRRLAVMVGAKHFVAGDKNVTFTFKMCKKATHCRITLLADDTYKVELLKVKGVNCTTAYEMSGVYNDSLKTVFETQTGLYLNL